VGQYAAATASIRAGLHMTGTVCRRVFVLVQLTSLTVAARAADLVALAPQTWDRYIPQGKEVDGIFGDFVLCNDQLVCVIANPRRGRNANMTVREVGGCLIDLTRRDHQSDQLSAFYPGAQTRQLRFAGIEVEAPKIYEAAELDRVFVQARRITLRLVAVPLEKAPDVELAYALEDGWPYVQVTTTFTNRGVTPLDAELLDAVRADHSFELRPEVPAGLFWAYDNHFGQAYGVVAAGHDILPVNARRLLLRYRDRDGKAVVRLAPGASYRLERRVIPGANLFDERRLADQLAGKTSRTVRLSVTDTAAHPVARADVVLARDGKPYAWGRTNEEGQLTLAPGQSPAKLTISALGHESKTIPLASEIPESMKVELPAAALVVARITDEQGGAIPCKVQFIGRDGAKSPNFGPDSGEHGIRNAYYSHDGHFRLELEPGSYDVIASHGPEYDAVFTHIDAKRGSEVPVQGKLVRSVKTAGWISTDFHSHSSPSGDNTSSQLGRVLNLLCEHVEFAPCTEHNRLYSGVQNNTIVNWLQLLNQGVRIPGVVNTDAHYNFHGSGWLRNYVSSPTDDPAEVRTLDVVRASERGHLILSSGPFLEVKMRAKEGAKAEAIAGDDLAAPGGAATLQIRVQCPNWFDVDRVQVFLNGRPSEKLNFTRQSNSARFSEATVKFEQEIPLSLERDTHVIVVAIGEQSKLGPVMGPEHSDDRPVAVSNPIFVDIDGGGFRPNGDTLGELPAKGTG
jgi:hypothetical protein